MQTMPAELRDGFVAAVAAAGLDGMIATAPGTLRFATGYWARSARMNPGRPGVLVWPVAGSPALLVGADQTSAPRRDSWIADVRGYAERARRPAGEVVAAIAAAATDLGLAGGRIGIELESLSAFTYQALVKALPAAEFVACDELCEQQRVCLYGGALDVVRTATSAAERGVMAALERARPGMTEVQLAQAIGAEISRRGVSDVLYVLLGAGPGARGFMPPTERVMQRGELVRIDLLAVHDGYFIDLGRMAVVGEPSPAQAEVYERQLELNRQILAAIAPGVPACEIFATGEREAAKLEVELLDQPLIGIGHMIGVNPKDVPMLKPAETGALRAGMVLNVEADVFGPEREVIHVEEMILVTDEGAEVLSDACDWSRLPRLGAGAARADAVRGAFRA